MVRISETGIGGVLLVEIEAIRDDRGYFARTWCRDEFLQSGLDIVWTQSNLGVSDTAHTLRGIHYQRAPHEEFKLVRCTRGAVFDVAVDLRIGSPTYLGSVGWRISHDDQLAVLIPPGCAHGYLTLDPNTHLEYLTSEPYVRDAADGIRFDDPCLSIDWPSAPRVISKQDATWPDWSDDRASMTPVLEL